jgi:ATP-dependent helicase HrpB
VFHLQLGTTGSVPDCRTHCFMSVPEQLPIKFVLPELLEVLLRSNCVVLQAPTGAGKTTRVPPALLDAGFAKHGQILLLEPRRLAARAAARRISFERGTKLGEQIGYQVRFDQCCTSQTEILVVTDGVLIRKLQDDPFLESISAILFDEFHERSLNVDLALAMVRRVQQTVRPDLKVVVMSATLTAEPVAKFLGNCPIITSDGRLYPVAIRYLTQISSLPMASQAAHAVVALLSETPGDILVFLAGVREIYQTEKALNALVIDETLAILPLYGDLPPEQQDAVLGKHARRKIVLATNVAETSVTIEGVTGVVDTGEVRQLQFDLGVGLDRLVLTRISQASADQRAGRAGRTGPGVCLRLWLEREQRGLPAQTDPEIRRVDVAAPVLELLCWGETDVAGFPWFEAPRPDALSQALLLLKRLGATEDDQPTAIGREIVRLPVHPRLARMLIEARQLRVADRVALIAALLTERDPFERTDFRASGPRGAQHHSVSDVLDRVQALEEFQKQGRTETSLGRLNPGAARFLLQAQQQLWKLIGDFDRRLLATRSGAVVRNKDEAVLRSILAAFPDRVARRRESFGRKGVMVGGRGVRLMDSSPVLEPELFVCVDTDAGQGEILVRMASGIERNWLIEDEIRTTVDVSFDPVTEKVVAMRRTRYFDLVIEEAVVTPPADCDVSGVLADAARQHLGSILPADDSDFSVFLSRVRCLKAWLPGCGLPDFDDKLIENLLPRLCVRARSFADLRKAPWLAAVKSELTYPQQQLLDREAPERIPVPSGSQIALHYEIGRSPVLAVRIQELFGLQETPRVAGAKIPVVLHLLGPNYRPQQITDDLKSFWDNTYPDVRKELKRRYPKHSWPEDPWTATPERKPGRKG